MNLKKMIKYSALGLVAVLATSALVACSSGKSASWDGWNNQTLLL